MIWIRTILHTTNILYCHTVFLHDVEAFRMVFAITTCNIIYEIRYIIAEENTYKHATTIRIPASIMLVEQECLNSGRIIIPASHSLKEKLVDTTTSIVDRSNLKNTKPPLHTRTIRHLQTGHKFGQLVHRYIG